MVNRQRKHLVRVIVTGVLCALGACGGDERTQAELVREGRERFEATCAACHGMDLKGTDDGPSFLDPIYASNHHPDEAFHRAARQGVPQHHWNFGPMPPQRSVTDDEVEAIIAYVRQRQREAGVTRDPSHD